MTAVVAEAVVAAVVVVAVAIHLGKLIHWFFIFYA